MRKRRTWAATRTFTKPPSSKSLEPKQSGSKSLLCQRNHVGLHPKKRPCWCLDAKRCRGKHVVHQLSVCGLASLPGCVSGLPMLLEEEPFFDIFLSNQELVKLEAMNRGLAAGLAFQALCAQCRLSNFLPCFPILARRGPLASIRSPKAKAHQRFIPPLSYAPKLPRLLPRRALFDHTARNLEPHKGPSSVAMVGSLKTCNIGRSLQPMQRRQRRQQ